MIKVSISGPMAVGKTTVIRKILESNPDYEVLLENAITNNILFKSICTRENTLFSRDLKQLIYLNDILERQSKVNSDIILLDKGIEDILFFWKQSIDLDFNKIKDKSLINSISNLISDYFSDLIIYLDASDENLYLRKNNDKSRDRGFFEYYMKNYRVKERKYFLSLDAKVILTDELSPSQTSQKVEQIIKSYQQHIENLENI